jgi:hypothetical protein
MQPGHHYGPPSVPPPPYPYADPYAAGTYGAVPYPAAAPYGAGPFPGQPVPPHLIGAPPPPGMRIVRKARVSASLALPLVGLLIVGLVCPSLPWVDAGPETFNLWNLMGNLWDVGADAMKTYSTHYFGWLWLVLAVWALFLSMAGTLDNPAWRILYGVVYCLIGLAIGGIMLLALLGVGLVAGASGSESNTGGIGAALGVLGVFTFIGLIGFVIGAVLLFKLHGVGYRILAGLGLMSFALVHLTALLSLPDGAELEPWAYLSVFGYLLCAVGCFIGPRYVRYYAR